jgi:hypothetical protein
MTDLDACLPCLGDHGRFRLILREGGQLRQIGSRCAGRVPTRVAGPMCEKRLEDQDDLKRVTGFGLRQDLADDLVYAEWRRREAGKDILP